MTIAPPPGATGAGSPHAPAGDDSISLPGVGRRRHLSNRRMLVLQEFEHEGRNYTVGVGFYPDGKLGEIFLDGAKVGSDAKALMDDAAVSVSRNIQHGDGPSTLAKAFTKHGLIRRALELAAEVAK